MNVQSKILTDFVVEMSPDGEIVVPEAVRRSAGILPGMKVVVGVNANGEVVILTQTQAKRHDETPDERLSRVAAALNELDGKYSTGQSTAEIMDDLRGSRDI